MAIRDVPSIAWLTLAAAVCAACSGRVTGTRGDPIGASGASGGGTAGSATSASAGTVADASAGGPSAGADAGTCCSWLDHPSFADLTQEGKLILAGKGDSGNSMLVSLVDPVSRSTTPAGVLAAGAQDSWSGALVYDGAARAVHRMGNTAQGSIELHTLFLDTGLTTRVFIGHDYWPCGVTSEGKIVGTYTTGSLQSVTLVDPATGQEALAGTLSDVVRGKISYDPVRRLIHAVRGPAMGPNFLVTLALDDGAVTTAPLLHSYDIGPTAIDGRLVAALFTSTSAGIFLVDPATGTESAAGAFRDFGGWDGSFTYDPSLHVLYVPGSDHLGASRVFSLPVGG